MPCSSPWDRPPFAKCGSAQRVLYEAIGRTLMNWEEIEGSFAHLYSAFVTGGRHDTTANRQYGEPLNFAHRIEGLKTVARRHFHKHPSQDTEGTFDEIIRLSLGWSGRRNDIAHGRARPSQWLSQWLIKSETTTHEFARWCVIPAHFRGEKFPDDIPAYILSSREIRRFGDAFGKLAGRVETFAYELEAKHCA
jgi:hypothetical protein